MANMNNMVPNSMGNLEWQTEVFRQSMVRRLEDAVKESPLNASQSPAEMEQRVFVRSKNRDDYLSLIARCILMVKGGDSGQRQVNNPNQMNMPQYQLPQQPLQQNMGQGMQQQGMVQQGGMQPNMQQIRMQQQQQQPGQMGQQQQMMQQMNQAAMRPSQPQGNLLLQQRLTQNRMPNQMNQQQQQQQPQQPRPQMMPQNNMMGNRMQMPVGPGTQMNPNMGMINQGPMMAGGQQRGPAPPYVTPSPGGMGQAGGSPMIMHGPSSSVPTQFLHSPGSSQSGLPSPGPRSNMAPSPMSVSIATPQNDPPTVGEEQAYLDKVKQLSRYIEPLSKMIAKIGNEDQEELGKMKKLMDILSNPTKRMPMETLLRCETVLERMNLDANDHVADRPAAATQAISSSSITPLLEAIVKLKNNQKSSLPLNHALHKTFGGPVEALYGSDISLPPLPKRRRRLELEDTASSASAHSGSLAGVTVPPVLQGEIARLQSHFKVSLDPAQPTGVVVGSIQLVCQLEDRDLPSVPPLAVTIPHNYPEVAPTCDTELPEYTSTPFLTRVQKALDSRLRLMPAKHTLSQLLNAWEMSVRAACSPRSVSVTPLTCVMGL